MLGSVLVYRLDAVQDDVFWPDDGTVTMCSCITTTRALCAWLGQISSMLVVHEGWVVGVFTLMRCHVINSTFLGISLQALGDSVLARCAALSQHDSDTPRPNVLPLLDGFPARVVACQVCKSGTVCIITLMLLLALLTGASRQVKWATVANT
mgnify:FL=1